MTTLKRDLTLGGLVALACFVVYAQIVASAELEIIAKIILWLVAALVVGAGIAGAALALSYIKLRIVLYKAEIVAAKRDSEVMTIVAARDEQVYIRDTSNATWNNMALESRPEFGRTIAQATGLDRKQWFIFQKMRAIGQMTISAGREMAENLTGQLPILADPEAAIPDHVNLESMLTNHKHSLGSLILGIAAGGDVVYGDARQLFHILVAGSTRWGKSIFLQMFLYQLLHLENAQVYLADLEGNTFVDFGLPFADTKDEIENLLETVWQQCQERKALFTADPNRSHRTLEQYNKHTGSDLPYIFCFLDEINGLLDKASPDYSPDTIVWLNTLGKRVAKYGVYLVVCGQDLRASVLPSGIKNQFLTLLQFKAMQPHQARNLIQNSEADKITVKGRAYAQINELGKTIELQVPFIEQETIYALRDQLDVARVAPWHNSKIIDMPPAEPLPNAEEARALEAFDTLRQAEMFTWNKATQMAFGDEVHKRVGKNYIDKLKRTLDKFEIDYSMYLSE